MRSDVCENCKFWKPIGIKRGNDGNDYNVGQCRRYAPHLLSGSGTGYYIHSFWATTDERDWCGEHQYPEGAIVSKSVEFQLPLPSTTGLTISKWSK